MKMRKLMTILIGLRCVRLSCVLSFQSGRFSHSANLYADSMVLFGGESQNGSLNNDLWLYNITQDRWTELTVNDTMKPSPVTEHTATVVDDKLYIFGGIYVLISLKILKVYL